MDGDQVVFAGPASQAPQAADSDTVIDANGLIVLPGLVDCHTHTIYGGSRADEWQRRLAGETYVEILESGGGINNTVRATRAASLEELAQVGKRRVKDMRDRQGVTTIEIKSGYGLTPEDEEKMLLAAKESSHICRIVTTFLGAHTIPPEFRGNENGQNLREAYVKQVIEEQLPRCAKVADCVDIFCDRGAFTLEEARRILQAGKQMGLKVRAHAEQIESSGCASLVAELGGISADHLEQLDESGAQAMGDAGVIAVLLPGAQLYLKDVSPPVGLLRKHQVKMAIATDFNPGSSPVHDLWSCATLACILQGCTVAEALMGITKHAGLALGLPQVGWLGPGSVADAILIQPPAGEPARIESILQHMGGQSVRGVIRHGQMDFFNPPSLGSE
mmetsp:Transcript_6865/g.12687  ORF Transcript_6865/g.12687 Transcript_6865/m.12687 type:complete len:390 (-) Transcript_6865:557-1726(-)